MFLILNIGILYLSGGNFRFLLFFIIPISGVCLFMYMHFPNWVCWVRGNLSGEPGHVYIVCVSFRCVEWRAGTILFDHCGGVGGGAVQVFRLLWLCSGGYSTVEMVRGGGPFFSFAFSRLLSVLLAGGYLR